MSPFVSYWLPPTITTWPTTCDASTLAGTISTIGVGVTVTGGGVTVCVTSSTVCTWWLTVSCVTVR